MTITPTVLTVRSTDDVVAMVPVSLGFHPTCSLVLLTFDHARHRPPGLPSGDLSGGFHARVDMPSCAEDVPAVVSPLHQAVRRHRPRLGAVVVYSDDVELGRLTGSAAAAVLTAERLELIDVVQVHDGHWWHLPRGRAPRHWRPERHAFDATAHPILTQRVFDGHVVLGSRAEVEESLRCGDERDAEAVLGALDAVTDRLCRDLIRSDPGEVSRQESAWLRRRLTPPLRALSPADVARVLTLTQIDTVRDHVCRDLTRERALGQLPLWREVVRRAPPQLVAGAAAVLALVAWLSGDGALAWCAVDRCRESEPDHELAAEVAQVLQAAVSPSEWTPRRAAR